MDKISEVIAWMLVSIFKFLLTPSLMVSSPQGYTYWEVIIVTLAGAVAGVLIFYYAGELIFAWIGRLMLKKKKRRRRFTRFNKFIVRIKSRFGLTGLVATIGIISVPLCSLLAARYFSSNPRTVIALILSATVWTLSLTSLSFLVKMLIH